MSDEQSLVLAHDPTSASLYDRYHDFGLATATETTDESGDSTQRQRLNDAERTALDQPLANSLAELPAPNRPVN